MRHPFKHIIIDDDHDEGSGGDLGHRRQCSMIHNRSTMAEEPGSYSARPLQALGGREVSCNDRGRRLK